MSYLKTVEEVYDAAAQAPDAALCCVPGRAWRLPDLRIPERMAAMNYGCGSTVDPRDLRPDDTVVYVGVGGGLEALQFAYFARRPGAVIAVDPVASMREQARRNLDEAARLNPWFRPEFVEVRDGNALDLPLERNVASVAAQNCLFNVFRDADLDRALSETFRVLRPGGFFATSDPIAPGPLPDAFRADDVARARCLSGCRTFDEYVGAIVAAGFGRIDVRARFPYRLVGPDEFSSLSAEVLLESVELAAHKVPDGPDGPAVFTGRTAIYRGPADARDDGTGTMLPRGVPVPVSDATATRLARERDVLVTGPASGVGHGGCC